MAERRGIVLVVRAGIWIALSLFFLGRDLVTMRGAQTMGKPVTVWMALQAVLWVAMLGFWLYAAWRGWKRGEAGPAGL
jgi:hypothetical protein